MGCPNFNSLYKITCMCINLLFNLATVWQSIVLTSVANPEGVPWVLWNPSFEGLPSKIPVLCVNVLRTLRSHWSYALRTVAITHVCHLIPVSRIRRAHGLHAWPSCMAFMDMLSVRERYFPRSLSR